MVSGRKGLCGFTGWSERAAVAFVRVARSRHRTATVAVRRGLYPAAAQIELQLSANMSVKEVAELYQEVRSELRGAFERHMNDKHLALALFIDEFKASGLGWKELQRPLEQVPSEVALQDQRGSPRRRFALEARRPGHDLPARAVDPRDEPSWAQPGLQ